MTDHPVRLPSEPALEARIAALLRSDRVLLAARDVAEIEYKKHADAGVSVGGSVTAATRAALDAALGAIFDELAALRVPAQEAPRYDLTPDELTRVERRADGIRADIQQQTDAFERSAQLSGEDRSIVVRGAAPRAVEGAAERIAELEAALAPFAAEYERPVWPQQLKQQRSLRITRGCGRTSSWREMLRFRRCVVIVSNPERVK